mmetsp:Transcript_104355/g.319469  ORF Transcript_104355/g.319469 Transcript_104355/m.319469 type:complete len:230 (-) Transcript_104355:2865-3554(-)
MSARSSPATSPRRASASWTPAWAARSWARRSGTWRTSRTPGGCAGRRSSSPRASWAPAGPGGSRSCAPRRARPWSRGRRTWPARAWRRWTRPSATWPPTSGPTPATCSATTSTCAPTPSSTTRAPRRWPWWRPAGRSSPRPRRRTGFSSSFAGSSCASSPWARTPGPCSSPRSPRRPRRTRWTCAPATWCCCGATRWWPGFPALAGACWSAPSCCPPPRGWKNTTRKRS